MPLENSNSGLDEQTERRRHIMQILAKADDSRLESAWEEWPDKPDVFAVRGPETGLVMIRGRIGGGGAPFNLGEASISRATIRLDTGEIGFGQTLGLTPRKAELAAIFDALGQRPESRDAVDALAAGIERGIAEADETSRRETAATRVDFFTMVRGED
jgi:alpha-D-ribose 1-methylphosphonate 5-triphosphate synthase subunit PhnG